jgi:UDP-N-acetylmuramyl tripeptide synthase
MRIKNLRFLLALWIGKGCAFAVRVIVPNRGSNIPGEIALKLAPEFLRGFRGIEYGKAVFITGTNGKSTTNNLATHVFQAAGRRVCSNSEGANLKAGVATTLLKRSTVSGKLKDEYLFLEVDERSLATVHDAVPAKYVCVTNIQKDQVQRNGDPDYIYQKIKAVVSADKAGTDDITLFVNNEEPRSKSLERFVGRSIRFGVAPHACGLTTEGPFGVTMPCPVCHDALDFSHRNLAGVGIFSCPSCGFASEAVPDCLVEDVNFEDGTFRIGGFFCHWEYTAPHFLYNYALAAAIALELGLSHADIAKACDTFTNIGGRMETFRYREKTVRYIRIKQENPETLQSALDVIAADRNEKAFLIGLDVVDDIIPHYSNTFYAFDCNFESFARSHVEKSICFSKTICYDMANRLRYAGIPEEQIDILDTDDEPAILRALELCRARTVYLITWIKKYEKLRHYVDADVSARACAEGDVGRNASRSLRNRGVDA